MEAKLERVSDGHQDGGTHSGAKQKKSVLKKVKDKAKKVKDTIKNHGHIHSHHHQQIDQLHGAPRYESSVVRETNLEKPKEDGYNDHPQQQPSTDEGNNEGLLISDTNNAKTETPDGHANPVADNSDTSNKPLSESASDYAHKLYEKVAAAGVNVMSKGSDNGKEYLSEKLKPGDEDKALSEAITDALHKKGDDHGRGKVTVSKEVAERLGLDKESKREGEDAVAAGEQSEGNTVSERLQNAFTSWLSKGTGIQTAQDSIANAFVNSADSASNGDAPKSDGPNPNPNPNPNEPRHR